MIELLGGISVSALLLIRLSRGGGVFSIVEPVAFVGFRWENVIHPSHQVLAVLPVLTDDNESRGCPLRLLGHQARWAHADRPWRL